MSGRRLSPAAEGRGSDGGFGVAACVLPVPRTAAQGAQGPDGAALRWWLGRAALSM